MPQIDDAPGSPRPETRPDQRDSVRASAIVGELVRMTPRDDPRYNYLHVLRRQLEADEKRFSDSQSTVAQYEEAYTKLTSPANRVAVFLGMSPDGSTAQIAMGDQEFVTNLDPRIDPASLKVGARVRVNESYAIVGDLGYHSGGPLAKVSETLGDDRLRVALDAQGMQSRVILRSTDLRSVDLKSGDEVRVEPSFKVAIEHHPIRDRQEYFLESIAEIGWEKVGGQQAAIQIIQDAIELPLLHPELYARFEKQPLKGILLYGPPGCGKTLIGKATAYNLTREYRERTGRDVKDYFMYISGPKVLNMWLGETERMIRDIFQTARRKAQDGYLVFIFVDEAESILRTRSSGRWLNISNTVVPQFCAEMDGLVSLENVVVMLTSNRPDYIDPAVLRPERIDRRVKVGRPDRKASRDILGIYLHPAIPVDPDLVREHKGDAPAARDELLDLAVEFLWRQASDTRFLEVFLRNGGVETLHWRDLVSGALLKSVVERAKDVAIKRSIARASDSEGITLDDLRSSIQLEYKESEIFPKGDTQEDWLKLLDYDPENVATVRPVRGVPVAPKRRNII